MGNLDFWWIIAIASVFIVGYAAIILEHFIKINKTASALVVAVLCWTLYFVASGNTPEQDTAKLSHYLADTSQILFFLLGAMAIVELVDSHQGFKLLTDRIKTKSQRKMLWIICFTTFFLSAILDNLTTTILMISLLKKIIPQKKDRFLLSCMVVVAANAGGAWTPIGDVTTTMLWIDGRLSSLAVIRALFTPSLVSLLVPLIYFTMKLKGAFTVDAEKEQPQVAPKAKLVLFLGVASLVFVPIFKSLTGLPPFMGIVIGLGVLWLVTDLAHGKHTGRDHLRIPQVLSKVDISGVLFFLGILLAVDSLQAAGILNEIALWLNRTVANGPVIATLIGMFSAIIDNVPLVAATMGMYPLESFPIDHTLWHMIAYAAGTGGSLLVIGSAAGIALMGIERVDFVSYMKKMTIPVFFGYIAGMLTYLFFYNLTGAA